MEERPGRWRGGCERRSMANGGRRDGYRGWRPAWSEYRMRRSVMARQPVSSVSESKRRGRARSGPGGGQAGEEDGPHGQWHGVGGWRAACTRRRWRRDGGLLLLGS